MSVAVHNLDTTLPGKVKNNWVAIRSPKFCPADLMGLLSLLNLWDSDTLLGDDVLATYSDNFQGLVNTDLSGLRDHQSLWLNVVFKFWSIVAGLLGNLLAVDLMTIAVLLVARVTHCHHLCDTGGGVHH